MSSARWSFLLSVAIALLGVQAKQSAPAAEPAEPPRSRLDIQGEWTRLADNEGDRFAVKFTYWRNLGARRRFSIEVPLVYADFNDASPETGLGDTWFKYYWLDFEKPTDEKVYQGLVPIFELLLPTGDEDKGLGGGAALVRPTVVLRFRPSARWSIDPLFRYVVSLDDYFVGGNPESPIPIPDEDEAQPADIFPTFDELAALVKVRGLNIEVPFVRTLDNNPSLSFIAVKPEIFHNSSEDDEGTTVTLKLEMGKRLSDRFGISGELQVPLAGNTTFDSVLKITGNIAF